MKTTVSIICLLIISEYMLGQCDIYNTLVVNVDSIDCCNEIDEFGDGMTLQDTSRYLNLYYKLICDESINLKMYNQLVDSFYIIDEKFKFSGTQSEFGKFGRKHRSEVLLAKRRILKRGYQKSLINENFLSASHYAKKLKRCFPYWKENKIKKLWEQREINNFEKYAEYDIAKLIGYHKSWLFNDATRTVLNTLQNKSYNHLIKIISAECTKQEFKNILEESIFESKLTTENNRRRLEYKLEFLIENQKFELYDDEISLQYYPDTILIDTVMVFDCYGNDPRGTEYVEIQHDTIKNSISNQDDLRQYKLRLRKSFLYNMVNKLSN